MAIIPKRTKYRKMQKGRNRGKATRGTEINYGEYGLVATSGGFLTRNQIEAARVSIMRQTKRGGKLWIKVLADKPITKKPAETRMGKGKGSPEYFVAVVKPGRVIFELAGVSDEVARKAFRSALYKLPVSGKIIRRELTAAEREEIEHEVEKAEEIMEEELEAEQEELAEAEKEALAGTENEKGGDENEDGKN